MGAPYYVDLPAAKVPANAMLDFSGLNSGLDTIREQNNQNAMRTYQQGRDKVTDQRANAQLGMEQQRLDLTKQQYQQQQEQQFVTHFGGAVQAINADPDPASRATKINTLLGAVPQIDQHLARYGVNTKDPDATLSFLNSELQGYQSPVDAQIKQAQLAEMKAKTAASQNQQDLLQRLVGGGPSPSAPQVQGSAQPSGPAPSPLGVASPAGRGALPAPGDPTAASGAVMPSMQTTPEYYTDEDKRNIALGIVAPRALSAIQQSPGHLIRTEQAKMVGKEMGQLEERQRAGRQILQTLGQLGATADDPNIDGAIGPYNTLPGAQAAKSLIPGNKSYDLNNRLNHDVEGLVTSFISSASRSGMTMSDKRQEAFKNTMGAMMRATSKPEFDKIMSDATNIIANTFNIPTEEAATYLKKGAAAAAPPAQPKSEDEYKALPSGTKFTAPDGTLRVKP